MSDESRLPVFSAETAESHIQVQEISEARSALVADLLKRHIAGNPGLHMFLRSHGYDGLVPALYSRAVSQVAHGLAEYGYKGDFPLVNGTDYGMGKKKVPFAYRINGATFDTGTAGIFPDAMPFIPAKSRQDLIHRILLPGIALARYDMQVTHWHRYRDEANMLRGTVVTGAYISVASPGAVRRDHSIAMRIHALYFRVWDAGSQALLNVTGKIHEFGEAQAHIEKALHLLNPYSGGLPG